MATVQKEFSGNESLARGRLGSVLALTLTVTAFGFFFYDTTQGIVGRWLKLDESYSHGFLVFAISLYLCQRNIKAIFPLTFSPSVLGLVSLAIVSFLWALANAMAVQVVEEFLLPLLLWLCFYSLHGWRQAKLLIVPLGFLYFSIPFWDYLAMPLQLITVAVNEIGFKIAGIKAEIQGIFVALPGIGTFEVAHGCSGLRYLVVGLTLTTLFGYLNFSQWRWRIALALLGVLFSLLANWIRVFVIIYVGHETNMESSLIEDHESFGWLVFAATLIPLFWIAHAIARKETDPEASLRGAERTPLLSNPTSQFILCFVFVAVIAVPVFYVQSQTHQEPADYVPLELPSSLGEWQSLRVFVPSGWTPEFRGYTQHAHKQYFDQEKQKISLSLYLYSAQQPGRELVQDSNRLVDAAKWRVISNTQGADDLTLAYNGLILEEKNDGSRMAVLHGYYVAGRSYSNRIHAKLAQALGYFNGRHDASFYAASSYCTDDCSKEIEQLKSVFSKHERDILGVIDQSYLKTMGAL